MRAVRRDESGKADNPAQRLELLADALVEKGLDGDVAAIREIGDRLDGKATQPISGDEDAPPVFVRFERVIVDPNPQA